MIACTVALLLVSAGFVTYELITFKQTMQRNLSTLAEIIGNESTGALAYDDKDRAEEILAALAGEEHITAAALYDNNGRIFAEDPRRKAGHAIFPQWPESNGSRFENDRLILFHTIRA